MTVNFRPALRENVSLIIGLAGGTGAGKTFTAMRLASGMAGDKPFAVIDTEAGRAKHYADEFRFDHADLLPPFRPDAYTEAIAAADKAGYPVIVVDSCSHEWAGEGGILDWQAEEFERMGGREATKLLSWSKPKQSHKKMVSRLLQSRAHLILCFRAEPHVEMTKDDNGKTVIRPKTGFTGYNGWFPVTEKNLPFELTVYFMFMAERPGVPHPIKLQEQHKALFPAGKEIDEEAGQRIAAWASGGNARTVDPPAEPPHADPDYITADQVIYLSDLCRENGIAIEKLCGAAKVASVTRIHATEYERAKGWITATIDKRKATA